MLNASPDLLSSLRSALPTAFPTLALPPGSLTHEQLQSQLQRAHDTGDLMWALDVRKASGRIIGGQRCPHAMARCVDRQAELELTAALTRSLSAVLGGADSVEIEIHARREYPPWQVAMVAEVVL